jgi:hypothetical protein
MREARKMYKQDQIATVRSGACKLHDCVGSALDHTVGLWSCLYIFLASRINKNWFHQNNWCT